MRFLHVVAIALSRDGGTFVLFHGLDYREGRCRQAMIEVRKDINIYAHTGSAWDAMYNDCAAAKSSIVLEQYIIRDDKVGERFLSLFAEKAKQGVSVKLILDKIGSRTVYNSPLIENIRRNGGMVYFYNNIGWTNIVMPWTWLPRTHLKLLLIDADIAYVGGACMAGYMAEWRDIVVRMAGQAAGTVLENYVPAKGSPVQDWEIPEVSRGLGRLQYVLSRPSHHVCPIYHELLARIDGARHSVCLVTPYLIPPKRLHHALLGAAGRGVPVRIIVTGKSDIPFANHVSHSFLPGLIRKGIRVFAYKKNVCHAKYAIIDGRWAMLGSANLDYLSLLHNREANLLISDPDTILCLKGIFEESLADCQELRADFWRRLPLKIRFIGYSGRLLKKIM